MSTLTGKTTATVRCGLCKEVIELESSFRPTPAVCPYCGLKFVFDPQEQPLPVRGMRLRWSEVETVQPAAPPAAAGTTRTQCRIK